jgi:hypothetical protein
MKKRPAITSASLFASSTRLPARAAAIVGSRSGCADDGGHHGIDIRVSAATAWQSPAVPSSTSVASFSARTAAREIWRRPVSRIRDHRVDAAGALPALRQEQIPASVGRSRQREHADSAAGLQRDDVERAGHRSTRWSPAP